MNDSNLKQNQRLIIEAFKFQNDQAYDEALQYNYPYQRKLQQAGNNLISIIENIENNSQFYMKHMPLMKQQRELINQKDYKQFISKNQKILCRNFQKNAYLALLMEQIQEKRNKEEKMKWSDKEEQHLLKLISEGTPIKNIYNKFSRRGKTQVGQKYKELYQKMQKGINGSRIQEKMPAFEQQNQILKSNGYKN